jgi:hypothetical protein
VQLTNQEENGVFPFLSNHGRLNMKAFTRMALLMLALVVAGGCASTEVTKRDSMIGKGKIPAYPVAT